MLRQEMARLATNNLQWHKVTFGLIKLVSERELLLAAAKEMKRPNLHQLPSELEFVLNTWGKSEILLSELLLLGKVPTDRVTLDSDEYKRLLWED